MWFKRRRRNDRPLTPVGALLVAQTEALLSGDFAEEARRKGSPIPAWSWLNVFAHGELSRVEKMRLLLHTTLRPEFDDEERSWKSAQQILANELTQFVNGDSDLLGLIQLQVLSSRSSYA